MTHRSETYKLFWYSPCHFGLDGGCSDTYTRSCRSRQASRTRGSSCYELYTSLQSLKQVTSVRLSPMAHSEFTSMYEACGWVCIRNHFLSVFFYSWQWIKTRVSLVLIDFLFDCAIWDVRKKPKKSWVVYSDVNVLREKTHSYVRKNSETFPQVSKEFGLEVKIHKTIFF